MDDGHDQDAVLHVAAMLYAAVLGGRPNLLDNVAVSEPQRVKIMRACAADAEALVELVYGRDDTPTVPPVVVPPTEGK